MNLRNVLTTSPHSKLLKERKQIHDAIESTRGEIAAAEAAVSAHRQQLGEHSAEAALGLLQGDEAGTRKRRTELRQLSEDLEVLHSRRDALVKKLDGVDRKLVDLEPSLREEREALIQKRVARWKEEYRSAAKVLHQAVLTGMALASISKDGGLSIALEAASAPDPDRVEDNLLHSRPVRRPDSIDRFDRAEAWEQNSAAMREHEEARSDVRELDEALQTISQVRSSGA